MRQVMLSSSARSAVDRCTANDGRTQQGQAATSNDRPVVLMHDSRCPSETVWGWI